MKPNQKAIFTVMILFSFFAAFPAPLPAAEIAEPSAMAPMKTAQEVAVPLMESPQAVAAQNDGRNDHQAKIFKLEGDVRILKNGEESWQAAEKDMVLEIGDQILTGKDSRAEIAYDSYFLNIARIEANTKAEFRNIEPTDLFLEDGTIFNALDGLAGQGYQISTPTAVAGVRGTTFEATFKAENKAFDVSVYQDLSGHEGVVDLEGEKNSEITILEGKKWDHEAQEIVDIPAEKAAQILDYLQEMDQEFQEIRAEGITDINFEKPAEKGSGDKQEGPSGSGNGNPPQEQKEGEGYGEEGEGSGEGSPNEKSEEYENIGGPNDDSGPNSPASSSESLGGGDGPESFLNTSGTDAFLDEALEPPAEGFSPQGFNGENSFEREPASDSGSFQNENSGGESMTMEGVNDFLDTAGFTQERTGEGDSGGGFTLAGFLGEMGMNPGILSPSETEAGTGTMPMEAGVTETSPEMGPTTPDMPAGTVNFFEPPTGSGNENIYVNTQEIIQDVSQANAGGQTGTFVYKGPDCPKDSSGNCI